MTDQTPEAIVAEALIAEFRRVDSHDHPDADELAAHVVSRLRDAGHTIVSRVPEEYVDADGTVRDAQTGESLKPCRGFAWLGQSFAHCDECGCPYWEHSHERRNGGEGMFSERLEPISPDDAHKCRLKWDPEFAAAASPTAQEGGAS